MAEAVTEMVIPGTYIDVRAEGDDPDPRPGSQGPDQFRATLVELHEDEGSVFDARILRVVAPGRVHALGAGRLREARTPHEIESKVKKHGRFSDTPSSTVHVTGSPTDLDPGRRVTYTMRAIRFIG